MTDAVRQANPQIPWRLVISTRNRLTPVSTTTHYGSSSVTTFLLSSPFAPA
ncbi:MAG: hypothetical protein PHD43_18885 [Methylococcales bacterium]|nr:hypothetical protein [Methylococcales bacterium]